jgi:AcrR family transcriptional regulator
MPTRTSTMQAGRPRPYGAAARSDDERTRAKLLESAGRVFAERGFYGATVREICRRARANVAAVNYHFGDKLGLYTEVLRLSIRASDLDAARTAPPAAVDPERRLRAFIHERVHSLFSADRPAWAFRLMAHEFAQPTPALARVVDDVLRPASAGLRETVGALLGLPADHETTRLCAHSVIGQIVFYVVGRPILARLWPGLRMTPPQLGRIAAHIADFSLAYVRRAPAPRRRGNGGRPS